MGVSKTLTDSAGVLSGDGDGWVLYGAGRLGIRPSVLPDPTDLSVSFAAGGELTHAANVTPNSAGTVEFDLPGAPVRPRSLTLEFRVMGERTAQQATVVAVDEGNGVLAAGQGRRHRHHPRRYRLRQRPHHTVDPARRGGVAAILR